jgi:hypothetical protein
LPALRGTLGRFSLVAVPDAPPSSACEDRRRDQRFRKKTEAIFEVFVIMAPAM